MNTELNGRVVINTLATAPVAAIPTIPNTGELGALIEAHRVALAHFELVFAAEDEASVAFNQTTALAPNFLSGGGYVISCFSIEEARDMLAQEYQRARDGLEPLARVAPDAGLAARAALDAKERENLHAVDVVYAAEEERREACGLAQLERDQLAAFAAAEAAASALCGYRCVTLDDARIKAEYILTNGDSFDTDECREALLRSFLQPDHARA